MPPCGDTVGEAFDNHTLDEAFTLVSRMAEVPDARLLPGETPQQRRERDLMRAVALHFRSARNDLAFTVIGATPCRAAVTSAMRRGRSGRLTRWPRLSDGRRRPRWR